MSRWVTSAVAAALLAMNVAPAQAQWEPYGALDVSRWWPAASSFAQHAAWPDREERTTLTDEYDLDTTVAFDARAGVRRGVGGPLAVGGGVGFTRIRSSAAGTVHTSIPHPILFDRPATASLAVGPYDRIESAVHLEASVRWSGGPFAVALFAGPSRIRVTQPLVARVRVDEQLALTPELPYTVVIRAIETREAAASAWGYTAGIDAAAYPTRHLGGGLLVRYSRADIDMPIVAQQERTGDASAERHTAGGWTTGVGVRVRF